MTKEVDSKCSIMVQFRKFIKIINHIKMQRRVRCKTGWAILRQNCSIGAGRRSVVARGWDWGMFDYKGASQGIGGDGTILY